MRNVLYLLGAIALSSVVIQKLIGGRKHIRSRADDPSIPPITTKAF